MTSARYTLALDQGTTSSRSVLFDESGSIAALEQREHEQFFPEPGWVEHDPEEIWRSQIGTATAAMARTGVSAAEISAIGIANQRETTIVWDRKTGEPIYPAIVWQDRRTAKLCDDLRAERGAYIREKTGLEVDAYFSASKIMWILENVPDARVRAENGELAFGTIDSWLIWKLTDRRLHVTDPSNASRTMLYDLVDGSWSNDLLRIFEIPSPLLPDIVSSSGMVGEVTYPGELSGIPITGIAGDQQAALFGQACFSPGSTKNTYGTGCFMLRNVGTSPLRSENRLISTVAWQIGSRSEYALEGSVLIGGAVVQWIRDQLGLIRSSGEIEALAAAADDNGGVYFVPAFVGLGAPYWDQDTRGTILGLTRGTGPQHIARAALEAIAFQSADLLNAMNADAGLDLEELRVDGGATENQLLLQFQADILGIPVIRSAVTETTALGAAYLAGLACGTWKDHAEISRQWRSDKTFLPRMSADEASERRARWQAAVDAARAWAK